MGLIGPDVKRIRAVGQGDHEYEMRLGIGDRVRLFSAASKPRPARWATMAMCSMSSPLTGECRDWPNLRTGKEGRIPWEKLTRDDGRIHLAYGDALTINAAQGMTTNSFIISLPSGSRAIDANDAYSAGTRQRDWSCIITNGQAGSAEVRQSRALNDTRAITLDDQWGNVGKHFAQKSQKDLALSLLEKLTAVHRGSVIEFAKQLQPAELRMSAGQPPSFVHEKIRTRQIAPMVRKAARQVHELHERLTQRLVAHERAHERQDQRQGPMGSVHQASPSCRRQLGHGFHALPGQRNAPGASSPARGMIDPLTRRHRGPGYGRRRAASSISRPSVVTMAMRSANLTAGAPGTAGDPNGCKRAR